MKKINTIISLAGARLRLWLLTASLLLLSMPSMAAGDAKCGGTDYSWGVSGLVSMVQFVTTVMTFVLGIVFTIGGIVSVIGAMNVYVKMNNGEDGVTKNIMMLVGGIIFMIGATMVMPAFFGWNFTGSYENFGSVTSSNSSSFWNNLWNLF